jgi:hypothetical protein
VTRKRRCQGCCCIYWAKKEKSTTCSERCRTRVGHADAVARRPRNNQLREQEKDCACTQPSSIQDPLIAKFNKLSAEGREKQIEEFRRQANRLADSVEANRHAAHEYYLHDRLVALRLRRTPLLRKRLATKKPVPPKRGRLRSVERPTAQHLIDLLRLNSSLAPDQRFNSIAAERKSQGYADLAHPQRVQLRNPPPQSILRNGDRIV